MIGLMVVPFAAGQQECGRQEGHMGGGVGVGVWVWVVPVAKGWVWG